MSVYSEIADTLKKQIKLGVLLPGSQLPYEIELAKQLSVTRKTLRNALSILDEERLIVRKKRAGTFIAENANELVQARFEICVVGDFNNPDNKNLFISQLTGDSHATEALLAVQQLLNDNASLRFISSREGVNILKEKADGFIVIDSMHSSDFLMKLADAGIPHVSFETHVDYPGVNTIMGDDKAAVRQSVKELYKKGHRKIAFQGGAIKALKFNTGIRRRTEAFIDICDELGLNCKQWIYNFDESVKSVSNFDILTQKLIPALTECSAVVCALGKGACSLLSLAEKNNIKMPEDVDMVCIDASTFDMLPNELDMLKKYPGFIKPRNKVASEGIKRLFCWIGDSNYKPGCYKVPFELNDYNKEC